MVINQSENEESGLILQSFSIVLLKIIPAVFSSPGKRGDVFYYSPQYSDETNLSLGSIANEAIASGRDCQKGLNVLGRTLCFPTAQGSLGRIQRQFAFHQHIWHQGSAEPAAAFHCGRQQQPPQVLLGWSGSGPPRSRLCCPLRFPWDFS